MRASRGSSARRSDFLLDEMRDAEGGFHAALDADSEGIEGKYYVWTADEIRAVAGDDAQLVDGVVRRHRAKATSATRTTRSSPGETCSARAHRSMKSPNASSSSRTRSCAGSSTRRGETPRNARRADPAGPRRQGAHELERPRACRVRRSGRVPRRDPLPVAAAELATFVRSEVWKDGRLLHTWKGGIAKVDGMLEDYAYVGLGLVELYKLTGDIALLSWARELWEASSPASTTTSAAASSKRRPTASRCSSARSRSSIPPRLQATGALRCSASGWGATTAAATGSATPKRLSPRSADHLLRAVTGFGTILQGIEFYASPDRELVIVGTPEARVALEDVVADALPAVDRNRTDADADGLPMFEGREPTGPGALAYVCENMMCLMPATTPEQLAAHARLSCDELATARSSCAVGSPKPKNFR